jgi:hypothetical protein
LNFEDFCAIRGLSARFSRTFDDGNEAGWLATVVPDGALRGTSGLDLRGHEAHWSNAVKAWFGGA